jgi:3-deoxy-D-manno-octulosonic-acid transferase
MARLPIDKAWLNQVGSGSLVRFVRFVHRTSRIAYDPPDGHARILATQPVILALWHGQTLMVPLLKPDELKVRIVVAMHGDGDLIGGLLTHFGLGLIRGAGAGGRKRDRGGARALIAAKRSLDEGWTVGMTADMPPGPARQAGLGIVMLARMSGRPIVPVAVASSRYHALDTWSRMTINLPWSKLVQATGEPIHVAAAASEAELEAARLAVERGLNEATARAYALCGADPARATPPSADPTAPPMPPGKRLKFYRAVMRAAEPLAPRMLSWREQRGKEDAARRNERLGIACIQRPAGTLIWVHAASVGELNAILPLIDALRQSRPKVRFLVTTGTTTSAALAGSRLDATDVHQYIPLDSPRFVSRFLDHWQPNLAVFTESELWPNLIIAAADRGIPLALVNGRLSSRSYSRWMKQRGISRPLLNRFAVVLAQTEKLSRWFGNLGARRSIAAGNLKVDAPPLPVDAAALAALRSALGPRPRLVVACTHEGEEEIAGDVHRLLATTWPDFCTVLAPRHPERGPAIAAMLRNKGFVTALRSNGALPDATTQIYVADTIGELGTLYRLATVAFLGKSLGAGPSAAGGQNPIEAIRHGTGVVTGPHVGNFHEIYQMLFKHKGAVGAGSAAAIAAEVRRLLQEPEALAELNAQANSAMDQMSGALPLTVDALLPLLPPEPPVEVAAPPRYERAS